MTIKTLLSATAVTIGIGIALPSNASVQVPYRDSANVARSCRPPSGQIYERGFRDARTPGKRMRRDFQLDGSYQ